MAQGNQWPGVRQLHLGDLFEVLRAGVKDFRAALVYGLILGGMYAAAGWLIIALLWHFNIPYLAYPLAMGFALVAPFAAVGFYAASDLLEKGMSPSWSAVIGRIRDAGRRDLRWMALVVGFALVIWMDIAALMFFGFMGGEGFGPDFLTELFTTTNGITFLLIGNLCGALIAMAIFSISVVSFPMLYERDIDFVTAMVTSVRLVLKNPATMAVWCAIIGILMGASLLTAFIGLLFTLPIIGHATWHLYRRAVEPVQAEPKRRKRKSR